jgi:hypothetical protein
MIDLLGQRFGRLVAMEFIKGGNNLKRASWRCECDCGNIVIVIGYSLRSKHTKSCGCLQKERVSETHTTHGQLKGGLATKTYHTWAGIIQRCNNPRDKSFKDYGGRGIKVCKRWLKFENFYADVGDVPDGMTIERINNNGDYEPENWRWATMLEQGSNKRNNVWIEYGGEIKTIAQWARSCGIRRDIIRHRIYNYGWSIEKALNTPVKKYKNKRGF